MSRNSVNEDDDARVSLVAGDQKAEFFSLFVDGRLSPRALSSPAKKLVPSFLARAQLQTPTSSVLTPRLKDTFRVGACRGCASFGARDEWENDGRGCFKAILHEGIVGSLSFVWRSSILRTPCYYRHSSSWPDSAPFRRCGGSIFGTRRG